MPGPGSPRILAWCGLADRAWDSNILFQRDRFTGWFARSAAPGTQRRIRVLQYSDTPLTVAVTHGATLDIHLQYWPEAFSPQAVATMAQSLGALLGGFAENPQRRVGDLPYLSAHQRQWMEASSLGPVRPGAAGLLLHADFSAQARLRPDRTALISDDERPASGDERQASGDERLTYGELAGAANALAHELVASGVGREEPVAILAERGAAFLVAVFAVLKAGAAFLPLSASHPDPELHRVLQAAGAQRCLAASGFVARMAALGCTVVPLGPDRLSARAEAAPALTIAPGQLAYLIATSGTTGTPKIVEVPHCAAANTLRHSLSAFYAEGDLDLVPWTDSSATDASIHQIFAPLACGGTLVRIANLTRLKASSRFRSFTAFGATPSMLAGLIAADALPPLLRAVMFGGEGCPASLPRHLRAATSVRRAVNVYGPTEAAIYCTADDVMAGDVAAGDGVAANGVAANGVAPGPAAARTIGRPIANMRVELLDDGLQPVLPGTPGEICISGVGLARGYRGRPDLTAAAFPVAAGLDGTRRRIYRSGDLAALLPDGRLAFHGRRDRQVKLRGMRVELDAVEHALAGLDGVRQAVVAVRTDDEGGQRLIGWVVPANGSTCTEAALRARLRDTAPGSMVPDTIVLVDGIGLSPTGKPDVAALPDPPPAPAGPPPSRPAGQEPDGPAKAPRGDEAAGTRLTALVAATFKLPAEAIGEASSMNNTTGWDSIRHIMLMMRIEDAYGIELSDREIAAAKTVARIRDVLRARGLP